jgi:hypothetical protein
MNYDGQVHSQLNNEERFWRVVFINSIIGHSSPSLTQGLQFLPKGHQKSTIRRYRNSSTVDSNSTICSTFRFPTCIIKNQRRPTTNCNNIQHGNRNMLLHERLKKLSFCKKNGCQIVNQQHKHVRFRKYPANHES